MFRILREFLGAGRGALSPDQRLRASASRLLELKNAHRGRCGFVIGNGPSLRITDLDRLTGQVTIASNKVFLAFDRTAWRPTYFTVVDDLIWSNSAAELHHHVTEVFVPSYLKMPEDVRVPVQVMRTLGNAADTPDGNDIPFSPHAESGVFGGYTVTYENLQLAVHLGLDPIYLIGCDHFYSGSVGEEGASPVASDRPNHFLPNYTSKGELMNPALVSKMTRSYQWARRYADASGVRILNATRGGHLEVFPRVDLDEVIAALNTR